MALSMLSEILSNLLTLYKIYRDRKFRNLRKFLASLPNINLGGCNYAAITLYDYLTDRGYEVEILYCYYNIDEGYFHNLNALNSGQNSFVGADHVVIKVAGKMFDCVTRRKKSDYKCSHKMTRELAVTAISTAMWNPKFDKYFNLTLLEQKIGYKFW